MKVEIVSCSNPRYWYFYNVGQVLNVEEHPYFSDLYKVPDGTVLYNSIRIDDCREVFEVIHKTKGKIEVIESTELCYQIAGKAELVWKGYCQPIKQEKEMKQEFIKSDLKNFMRVKYRDGSMRVFIEGRFYAQTACLNHVDKYTQELYRDDGIEDPTDIIAVYDEPITRVLSEDVYGKLIWERKEKSQQEIELEKLQQQIKELEKQAQKLKETLK